MKLSKIIFLLIFFSNLVIGQDCRFFSDANYQGTIYDLNIGESLIVDLPSGDSPSLQILNSDAAGRIDRIDIPDGYGSMFVYSENSFEGIGGTNQYEGKEVNFQCLNNDFLPEPEIYLPIDASNVNTDSDDFSLPQKVESGDINIGDKVLVLRKAYLWENSEDLGCPHGPWASISFHVHNTNILSDFNFDVELLAQEYCGSNDSDEFWNNDCTLNQCYWFNENYPVIDGNKLPGQVAKDNSGCVLSLGPDPKSEWVDGFWGMCYSNIPIFNWSASNLDQIALILREGDVTNCDDLLGAMIVSENSEDPILFKARMFGWVLLENIIVPSSGEENSLDVSDFYWINNFDESAIDLLTEPCVGPTDFYCPYEWTQYYPLINSSIDEMEEQFDEVDEVGLLGGSYPTGVLNDPKIYRAPCKSAIWGDD